jgi:uncharacterized protein YbgA (DUF1722 family)/uncharacterized protein YbbK (DUF523 family)
METVRPRVAVSRCLLGDPVRYNRGHSRSRFLTDQLARYVDWAPICPEIEIGLGAPRQTLRLLADGRLVNRDGSADHTEAMTALAERRAADLAEVDGYVLKSRSPSCGLRGSPRYQGDQPADRTGVGMFAAHMAAAFPALPMEEDGRLNDAYLRERFVERIFAHARLRAFFATDWRPGDLVDFHSRHKLQILAHDPVYYRELGRIVARAGTEDRRLLQRRYTRLFNAAFAVLTRRGRHVNALQHLFGPMSGNLDDARRRDIAEVIDAFGRGVLPLSVPIALLGHDARGTANGYLQEQTYLEPFPIDLALRNHT